MKRHYTAVLLSMLLLPVLAQARTEGHFDRTLQVSGNVNLDLTTGSGDISVKSGSSNQVVVHAIIHGNNDWFSNSEQAVRRVESNPPIEQSGNSIRIGYNLPDDVRRHVSINYDITVPANTALQAHSGSGNVVVEGLHGEVQEQTGSGDVRVRDVSGKVRVQTGSGNIHTENVAGPFSGQTGSGDIEANLVDSSDVDVQTGSGNIHVKGVKGGLRARSGSGDITADGQVAGNWQLHSGSGNFRLGVGNSGGFNLDAHTSSGSIHSDLPITMQGSLNKNELKGAVRGGGPDVVVSTSSGNVEIR
jgi:DUF4097 and DUF4098 domain-containing protein YvlB